MAVSKRTRYEVLRRDNFTCRYCRSSGDQLTVDHVNPVALGGSDSPDNLVAACRDCNAGKSSTAADSVLVGQVEEDAIRWAAAIAKAAEITDTETSKSLEVIEFFEDSWWSTMPQFARLPDDYADTVVNFAVMGLSRTAMQSAVRIASAKSGLSQRDSWRYFCGICWNKVRDLQKMAQEMIAAEGAN